MKHKETPVRSDDKPLPLTPIDRDNENQNDNQKQNQEAVRQGFPESRLIYYCLEKEPEANAAFAEIKYPLSFHRASIPQK